MEDPSDPFLARADTAIRAIEDAVSNPNNCSLKEYAVCLTIILPNPKSTPTGYIYSDHRKIIRFSESNQRFAYLPRPVDECNYGPQDAHHKHMVMFRIMVDIFNLFSVLSSFLPDLFLT